VMEFHVWGIPISQWSSSVYLSSGSDNSVSALNWTAATTEVALSYGATGATNVTTYSTKTRRVADSLDFFTRITFSGAANADGNILLTIPNALSIDTAKIATQYDRVYPARLYTNSKVYLGLARYYSATQLHFSRADDGGATNASWVGDTTAGDNVPGGAAIAASDTLMVEVHGLPISGWTAEQYLGMITVGFATAGVGRAGLVDPYDTTKGVVYSGTYTPTLTNTTNVGASTAYECHYIRVGSQVTVTGVVEIDASSSADTATVLGISLPVASNFTATVDARGLGVNDPSDETRTESGYILADTTNDRVTYNYLARSSPSLPHHFTFMYTVK